MEDTTANGGTACWTPAASFDLSEKEKIWMASSGSPSLRWTSSRYLSSSSAVMLSACGFRSIDGMAELWGQTLVFHGREEEKRGRGSEADAAALA